MFDLLTSLLAMFVLALIFVPVVLIYLGQALGLSRMMRTLGLDKTWTAWVPVVNCYALGSIADHQAARNEGKTTVYHKKLLIWALVMYAVSFLLLAVLLVTALFGALDTFLYAVFPDTAEGANHADMLGLVLALYLIMIPMYAVEIVYLVYYYICLHKVYKLFAPDSAVGLTVLSILVSVSLPIVLFVLSKRPPIYAYTDDETDDFMPPPDRPAGTYQPGGNIYSR